MSVKVLLLYPPIEKNSRAGRFADCIAVMPGLGLLYIASILRENNFDVRILDSEGLSLTFKQTVERVKNESPDVIGITSTNMSIVSCLKLVKVLKGILKDTLIFIGGPHVTAVPEETLKSEPSLDACFLGDSELTFLKAVKNINENKLFYDNNNGIVYRRDSSIIRLQKKGHFKDLDKLPFPAWDLLELFPKRYRPPFHSYHKLPLANIVTTRGCPMLCTFCDRSVFGDKLISHSNEYVVEMIQKLVSDFGIREISIKDDMFTFSKKRVLEFCELLQKKNINISWNCNARVNSVDLTMLKAMKKSGCWLISYGIESGSEKMLSKMDKRITKNQVVSALKMTREVGIASKGFFMTGIPGETKETVDETLCFIKTLPLDEISINYFTPFPGTKLYNEAVEDGFKPDYQKMNMQELVYCPSTIHHKDLKAAMKKIIYTFYLNPKKLGRNIGRSLKNYSEFKRFVRMSKAFLWTVLK